MDNTNKLLQSRLANIEDDELLEMISNDSQMYSNEVVQTAQEIAISRGLFSKFGDSKFKLITPDGGENNSLDIISIKDMFLKGKVNDKTLVYIESAEKWFPLHEVFDVSLWTKKDTEEKFDITALSPTEESLDESGQIENELKITSRPNEEHHFIYQQNVKTDTEYLTDKTEVKSEGGIGRLGFLIGLFVATFLIAAAEGRTANSSNSILSIIALIILFALVVSRLNNIGKSGWWALMMFVPVANLWILIQCLACQAGFERTKELDTTGRVINAIIVGFVVLVLAGLIFSMVLLYGN